MSDFIQDGTGTGYRAEVDAKNRLATIAATSTSGTNAALDGDLFNINTETLTLTTANASTLLYLKNTDTVPWVIDRVFYNAAVSTGGTSDFLAELIANPTAGTIISDAITTTPHNLNFSSTKTLTGDVFKGSEGKTVTNGTVRVSTIIPASGTRVLIGFDSIVMDAGSSMAVKITPQTGNTSMDIQVGVNLHRFTD